MEFVTLEEVIKFAIDREHAAYELYTRAAELSSGAAKKMFQDLVAEEAAHRTSSARSTRKRPNSTNCAKYRRSASADICRMCP